MFPFDDIMHMVSAGCNKSLIAPIEVTAIALTLYTIMVNLNNKYQKSDKYESYVI